MLAQCAADERPDSQIRDIVIVHDIEVNDVCAGGQYRFDLFTQTGKVGRQYRWGDQGFTHD